MILSLLVPIAGCQGEISVTPTKIQLALHRTADGLQLDGSLLDPLYQATYPNPLELSSMTVVIDASGEDDFILACQSASGASKECGDPPFFAELWRGYSGFGVKVYDMYGTMVADHLVTYQGSVDQLPEGSAVLPEETPVLPPLDEQGDSAKDKSGKKKNGVTSNEAVSPATLEAVKIRLTELINERLKANNLNFTYTSDMLSTEPAARNGAQSSDELPVGCWSDITKPANDQVLNEFGGPNQSKDLRAAIRNLATDARWDLVREGICNPTPLVLDLAGDGIQLSSLANGVKFDLLGIGRSVTCAWIQGDDALLVLDRNGNNQVDDATELFGSISGGERYANGFSALAALDTTQDGVIDAQDERFNELRVWQDMNHDGVSTESELSSLDAVGIVNLRVSANRCSGPGTMDSFGNWAPLVSHFMRSSGNGQGTLKDVYLPYQR